MEFFDSGVGRKFLLICYVQTVLFILLYAGKLPVQNFEFLTMLTVGGYIGGNLGQRVIDAKIDKAIT